MTDFGRALWINRAIGSTVIVAIGSIAAVAMPSPYGAVTAAVPVLLAVTGLLVTGSIVASLQDGSVGEVMLRDGARVPLAQLRRGWQVDRAELAVLVLVSLVVAASNDGTAGFFGFIGCLLAGLLLLLVTATRRLNRALIEAQTAMQRHDPVAARRWLAKLAGAKGVYADSVAGIDATLRLYEGDIASAVAAMDRLWDGTLDARAASVAVRHLGQGDRELAKRWLHAYTEEHRYARYLIAMASAHLALVDNRPEEAVSLALGPIDDVPRWYQRELMLVAAAGHRTTGDDAAASELLAGLTPGIDSEPWRAHLHPHVWRVLHPGQPLQVQPASMPTPRRPDEQHSPFAAPHSPPKRATGRTRFAGLIPVDWVPITRRRGRSRTVLLAILTALLVGVTALLTPLTAIMWLGGETDAALLPMAIMVLALSLVAAIVPRVTIELLGTRGPALTTSDGAWIPQHRFSLWSASMVAPAWVLAALLAFPAPLAEYALQGTLFSLLGCLPLGLLFAWVAHTRGRALRVLGSLHIDPPAAAIATCERALRGIAQPRAVADAGLGLMTLWHGDIDRAETLLDTVANSQPTARTYASWIRAARGEVDLAQLLTTPTPDELPDAWRHAVLVGLAALQARRAEAVVDRLDAWDALTQQLPNRFGALLWRIGDRVRQDTGAPRQPGDLATDAHLQGLLSAWSFLAEPPQAATSDTPGSSR